jgi:Tfp pilus assembly protein PilN
MIRINLLGTPKPKNKRSAVPAVNFEMSMGEPGSPKTKILILLLLAGSLNGLYWYRLDREGQSLSKKMQQAEQQNRELADVKARYLERQREADNYKRRVDVIDQLRASQAGPVELLNTIGDTINGTEAVWLNTMKDLGANVDIEGTALSTDAVAALIHNLEKTGRFSSIEIKETFQDDGVKDMQAFQFTLTCTKAKS